MYICTSVIYIYVCVIMCVCVCMLYIMKIYENNWDHPSRREKWKQTALMGPTVWDVSEPFHPQPAGNVKRSWTSVVRTWCSGNIEMRTLIRYPSDIPIQNPVGTVIITSFPLVLKDSMICWPIFGNIVAYWLASTLLKVCLGGIKWMILHLSYLFVSYGITQDRVSLYGKGNPLVQSIPHWKFCPFHAIYIREPIITNLVAEIIWEWRC